MVKNSSSLRLQNSGIGEIHIIIGVRDGKSWAWNSKSPGGAGYAPANKKPTCLRRSVFVCLSYRLADEASRLG